MNQKIVNLAEQANQDRRGLTMLAEHCEDRDPPAAIWALSRDGGRGDTVLGAGQVGLLVGQHLPELISLGLQFALASAREDTGDALPSAAGFGLRRGTVVFATRNVSEGRLARWASDLNGPGKLPEALMTAHHYNAHGLNLFESRGYGPLVEDMLERNEGKAPDCSLLIVNLLEFIAPDAFTSLQQAAHVTMNELRRIGRKAGAGVLVTMRGWVRGSTAGLDPLSHWRNNADVVLALAEQLPPRRMKIFGNKIVYDFGCVQSNTAFRPLPAVVLERKMYNGRTAGFVALQAPPGDAKPAD